MEFQVFNQRIQDQFAQMCKTGRLFRADVSGQQLWDLYLSSFENEKMFRDPESSEHNCNCCKNFIRRYGNIVTINDAGTTESMFTGIGDVGEYTPSAVAVDALVRSKKIQSVFFETYKELNENLNYESTNKRQETFKLGIAKNLKRYNAEEAKKFGVVESDKVYEFHHFCIDLPKQFVNNTGKSIGAVTGPYQDKYSVFKRAMEEIPMDTLLLVKDLINQGSLLDGTAHLSAVEAIINQKKLYDAMKFDKAIACWLLTYDMHEGAAKFKNHLIGVLCSDLAEGMELNEACKVWNIRVDPVNYNKATAPVTEAMKKAAKKEFHELGYVESDLLRRAATMEDIKADEILHLNAGDGTIAEASIFDSVATPSTRHKKSQFKDVEEVGIEKFMKDILPTCTSIEAFFENRMQGNLVTMTTSKGDTKPMFKWSNPYSWTFNGNLAGKSQIREAVKSAGGKVDGVLRFSIMWAEKDGDNSDLDAHCQESAGEHIYYGHQRSSTTRGVLDVDITNPKSQRPAGAVENITYPELGKMKDGTYDFYVRQYSARSSKGFKAEIAFGGEEFSYEYNRAVSGNVKVATVTLKAGTFTIKHHLPETNSSKEVWGIDSNDFHTVNLVCLSPNHWGDNEVGNKHYMFMIDKCKCDVSVRGFHNENLNSNLLKHRKMMEVLGGAITVEPIGKQLSGLGFNSTVKDELIVKVRGTHMRVLKLKF